jgi:hypothetical protein
MSDNEAPKSFNEACQRFSRFLQENGYPEQILWVGPSDVVWHRRLPRVHVRPTPTRWESARQRYATGLSGGFGVSLFAFSELDGTSIAAVILPTDDDAAQRSLIPPRGLKLSAATKKLGARRVANRMTWLIQSVLHRRASRLFGDEYLGCS